MLRRASKSSGEQLQPHFQRVESTCQSKQGRNDSDRQDSKGWRTAGHSQEEAWTCQSHLQPMRSSQHAQFLAQSHPHRSREADDLSKTVNLKGEVQAQLTMTSNTITHQAEISQEQDPQQPIQEMLMAEHRFRSCQKARHLQRPSLCACYARDNVTRVGGDSEEAQRRRQRRIGGGR